MSGSHARSNWFDGLNYVLLTLMMLVMICPFVYVFSMSVSSQDQVAIAAVYLWPKGFNLEAYTAILKSKDLIVGYRNTLLYTVLGTIASLTITCLAAYALSRGRLYGRRTITVFISMTMFFVAGIIPNFLSISALGLINQIWAVVLPMAFSAWNILIMRTSFASVHPSMLESAELDGANDWTILFKIVIPVMVPIVAAIGMFSAVLYWNDFIAPLLYLNKQEMFPLQLVIRKIVLMNSVSPELFQMSTEKGGISGPGFNMKIKMAAVILTVGPILLIYPFVQRFFVNGLMLGSVKG